MKPESERMVKKYSRRPLPESFQIQLERWANFSHSSDAFFRDTVVVFDPDGPCAEVAMFVFETHGEIVPTKDVSGFKNYLQGKSIEGLMRKMWKEDVAFVSGKDGAFWAEELVIAGKISFKEAERLFTRKLNGNILWMYAWTEGVVL